MDTRWRDRTSTDTASGRFVALWRAVFTRTIRDALGQFPDSVVPAGMTRSDFTAEARRILEHADEAPYSLVVDLAGFDPGYVAKQARRMNWESLELPPQ